MSQDSLTLKICIRDAIIACDNTLLGDEPREKVVKHRVTWDSVKSGKGITDLDINPDEPNN